MVGSCHAIGSEAGELLSELRWIRSEDADAHCRGEARPRIADELGDVLITLMLCDRIGLDPIETIRQKMAKVHPRCGSRAHVRARRAAAIAS